MEEEELQTVETSITPDWRANFPEDMQGALQKYNEPIDMVKAYLSANNLLGKRQDQFNDQDWANYVNATNHVNGVPENYTDYMIGNDDIDPEDIECLQQFFHENGLNNEQAEAIYNLIDAIDNSVFGQQEEQLAQQEDSNLDVLVDAWGNAAEHKLQAVENCIDQILPHITGIDSDDIRQTLIDNNLTTNPVIMSVFSAIGALNMESGSYGYSNIAPMDANARLQQLRGDAEWMSALVNRHHPNHKSAYETHSQLIRMKNGE